MYLPSTFPFVLFEAILLSLLTVLVLAWGSIRLAARLHLVDFPGSEPHKQHSAPTPLAGGIALAITLLLTSLVFKTFTDQALQATFLGAAVIFFFGLLDDRRSIRPLIKLAAQIAAAALLITQGVYIQIFESPEFFLQIPTPLDIYLDWGLSLFWLVGITNAFNFVDSMDGLAVGLGGMAGAFFMLVTLASQQQMLSLQCALIIGTTIGLYFFNSPPALLFLGDSGAQTLGFILAGLAIIYRPMGANQSSSWFVPILLLWVPIFDTTLVVLSRLRRKRPIYSASRDHTYHRLLSFGVSAFRSVLVMQMAALALACLAFIILTQPPLVANIVFGAVLLASLVTMLLLDRRKYWQ